jgi:hypothetical protein
MQARRGKAVPDLAEALDGDDASDVPPPAIVRISRRTAANCASRGLPSSSKSSSTACQQELMITRSYCREVQDGDVIRVTVLRGLGQGGQGAVVLVWVWTAAVDGEEGEGASSGFCAALKLFHPDSDCADVKSELKMNRAAVKCPCVVQPLAECQLVEGSSLGQRCMLMEAAEMSLADLMKLSESGLPLPMAKACGRFCLNGAISLAERLANNVTMMLMDCKSDNILAMRDGQLVFADLGSAVSGERRAAASSHQQEGGFELRDGQLVFADLGSAVGGERQASASDHQQEGGVTYHGASSLFCSRAVMQHIDAAEAADMDVDEKHAATERERELLDAVLAAQQAASGGCTLGRFAAAAVQRILPDAAVRRLTSAPSMAATAELVERRKAGVQNAWEAEVEAGQRALSVHKNPPRVTTRDNLHAIGVTQMEVVAGGKSKLWPEVPPNARPGDCAHRKAFYDLLDAYMRGDTPAWFLGAADPAVNEVQQEHLRSFVTGCCSADVTQLLTAEQLLQHPWLKDVELQASCYSKTTLRISDDRRLALHQYYVHHDQL